MRRNLFPILSTWHILWKLDTSLYAVRSKVVTFEKIKVFFFKRRNCVLRYIFWDDYTRPGWVLRQINCLRTLNSTYSCLRFFYLDILDKSYISCIFNFIIQMLHIEQSNPIVLIFQSSLNRLMPQMPHEILDNRVRAEFFYMFISRPLFNSDYFHYS